MFTLNPESIVARVKASSLPLRVPTIGESILRGMIGFTVVSLGGFAPWVLGGRWFYRTVGELGLYAVCALAFIGLSGPLLHRLIIGPGSLSRCYKIFSLAFFAYAAVWTIAWMSMARSAGSVTAGIVGAIAGIAVMGAILALGFKSPEAMLKVILGLFVGNVIGYFVGEWAYNGINALKEGNATGFVLERQTRSILSKTAWGLFYGLGFGGGIGLAFYACQAKSTKAPGNALNCAPTLGAPASRRLAIWVTYHSPARRWRSRRSSPLTCVCNSARHTPPHHVVRQHA